MGLLEETQPACDLEGDPAIVQLQLQVDAQVMGSVEHRHFLKLDPLVAQFENPLRQHPRTGIVLLCIGLEPQSIDPLREYCRRRSAGFGLIIKPTLESIEQLLQVVQTVVEGRMVVDPSVMGSLVSLDKPVEGDLSGLSPREFEVLRLMSKGLHNTAIADVISVERATVERYIHNIYGKLGERPDGIQPRAHAVNVYQNALEGAT